MAATGVGIREVTAFHRGTTPDGRPLSAKEREELIKPFLPPAPASNVASPTNSIPRRPRSRSARKPKTNESFLKNQLFVIIYTVLHAVFSVCFRFRRAWHAVVHRFWSLMFYHHRAPEYIQKDVKDLGKLPEHLSVILEYHESDDDQGTAGLEGLINDVCEITAWCASAGIPYLSIYEETGILKNRIPQTYESISQTLESYFGKERQPSLSLRAPHLPTFSPPPTPPLDDRTPTTPHITVLLLSASDGRDTMVDLTKTLAEMAQKDALNPHHISADLIDLELSEAVSGEPELLILFSPTVELKGYPPWQVRLTEIFHVPDNKGVNYQVFIRALHNFTKAEMRLGR